jgi:hypothetical protein
MVASCSKRGRIGPDRRSGNLGSVRMSTTARVRDTKEIRGFHKIRRSASSSRILNLIELTEASARSTVPEGPAEAPERIFHTNALNYSILLKHNVRAHERELFSRNVQVATKVFVPFDPRRLDIGGRSFFIEEDLFKDLLRELVHIDVAAADAHIQRDVRTLEVLSQTPTLDPFIITERLRCDGIAIKPSVFSDSYAVTLKASSDVFQVFKPLVEKALGKIASPLEMTRFVDQVWNVNGSTTSNPFLEALRIPRTEWADVIFAWKALIYYELTTRESPQRLHRVFAVLRELDPKRRVSDSKARELLQLKKDFAHKLFALHDGSSGYIRTTLKNIVDAILSDSNASALSDSLRSMAGNISSVGTDVVLFDQVASYFLFLFPKSTIRLDPEDLEANLVNLCEIIDLQDDGED